MKVSIARREFIKRLGVGVTAFGGGNILLDNLLRLFISRAYAQESVLAPGGYYIHLNFPGGPPRWMFDSLLTPFGRTAANFLPGGFGTVFEKIGTTYQPNYSVKPFSIGGKSLHLPPVWGMNVASQNFSDILAHTLFIRGIDMEINNHSISNARQVAPIIGGYSLTGIVADAAKRPMPGVVDPGSSAATSFRSKRGLSPNPIVYTDNASTNPIATMLRPFQNTFTSRLIHSDYNIRLQEQAFGEFEKYADRQGITTSALSKMYDNAMEMVEQNVFNLSNQWASTVTKYRNIVNLAMHPNKGQLPGIYDAKITTLNNGQYRFDENRNMVLDDLRDMVIPATNAPRMAENFAIAEILLDKITASLNLSFPSVSNAYHGAGNTSITHDQHRIGNMVSTLMTTLFYRGFLGCLTEFISVLKSRNLFDRTVIHISSEFNRTPRADGIGSDHAFMGSNTTLISGMVQGPSVVGNIQKAHYTNSYQGTFGVAAPYSLDGYDRPIQTNDVVRTITAMLGVEDIVTNGYSLLAPGGGGGWKVRKEEAKNV